MDELTHKQIETGIMRVFERAYPDGPVDETPDEELERAIKLAHAYMTEPMALYNEMRGFPRETAVGTMIGITIACAAIEAREEGE